MKHGRLLLLLVFTAVPLFSQDIYRPTTDAHGPTYGACGSTNQFTSSMPYSYDSDASTESDFIITGPFGKGSWCDSRAFLGFSSATRSYSQILLKVNSACILSDRYTSSGGYCEVKYSLDGGATITGQIKYSNTSSYGTGWSQETDSVTLPSNQDLTQVIVYGQNLARGENPDFPDWDIGQAEIIIWDIRIEATP
ncbi:MAG: hypothetical protein JWO13_415 [Acidobacteriales bacterium]|nr:hypothetical protein [Terriglobales bacterium]